MNYQWHESILLADWDTEIVLLHPLSGNTYYYGGIAKDMVLFCVVNKRIFRSRLLAQLQHKYSSIETDWVDYVDTMIADLQQKDLLIPDVS